MYINSQGRLSHQALFGSSSRMKSLNSKQWAGQRLNPSLPCRCHRRSAIISKSFLWRLMIPNILRGQNIKKLCLGLLIFLLGRLPQMERIQEQILSSFHLVQCHTLFSDIYLNVHIYRSK